MTTWNPNQYLKFEEKRTRPAIDLASNIKVDAPERIIDLGCGPGTSTMILRNKWPQARISGLDASAEMIEKAKAEYPEITWIQANLNNWRPTEKYDVIFSNAALQWVAKIDRLLEVAFGGLTKGGALAFQVPNNEDSPYQQCIITLAGLEKWSGPFRGFVQPIRYGSMEFYYEALSKRSSHMDIWETRYYQIMDSRESILEWVSGTGLRPYLKALGSDSEREAFKSDLLELYRESYPRSPNGKVIFPFKRQFVIAYK